MRNKKNRIEFKKEKRNKKKKTPDRKLSGAGMEKQRKEKKN